jgi:hypothetical protein
VATAHGLASTYRTEYSTSIPNAKLSRSRPWTLPKRLTVGEWAALTAARRRKRKHPQFAHGRPPMNSRTWCLSPSSIRNNRSLPLRLARCSVASSAAAMRRIRRYGM